MAFLTLFSACKNPEIDYNTFTITAIDVKPASHNVTISGSYDFSGEVAGMTLNIGLDEQLADVESHPMNIEGQSFSANVNNLDAGTQYYYCLVVEFGDRHKLLTEVSEFTTLKTSPLVRTVEVRAINNSTLQVKSIVDDDGGSDITERGVCWNLTGNPNYTDSHVTHQENDIGEYSCQINGFEHNTTYYVRAYAKNEKGFGLGNVISFTTGTLPTVETLEVTDITDTTAICSGTVVAEGTSPVTERGICWSTEPNSTIEGIHANGGAGIGSFSVEIIDLTPNTTYYVRAYATNSIGTVYGREVNFTTSQISNYTIAVSASPTSGGTVTGGGTYQQGQNCTVHAKANSNYSFTNWTENGNEVSTNANYTFTVNENRSLVANFVVHSYTINVSASPSNGGTVTGGGTYQQGQYCTVHAEANSNYTFTNWTENGSQVSTNANYTFTVTGNRTLVAHFAYNGGSNAPTGAINGLFSVSASQKVYFSQGNLQYIGSASTPYWKFADNQWDVLGANTGQNSYSKYVDRDLFGWGTSGYDHGAVCFQPWSTYRTNSYYYAYEQPTYNLYDQTGLADWGYNAISNGGSTMHQWRTLRQSEWDYVFNTRTTTSGIRYAKAQVNNVNGVILLPDNWSASTYSLSNTNQYNSSFSSNVILASQWITLQNAGAVFLPAAGYRSGTSVSNVGSSGLYWSSSCSNVSDNAFEVSFSDGYLYPSSVWDRYYGLSVRLVAPAE